MVEWHHQLKGLEFEATLEDMKDREAWCAAAHGVLQRVRYNLVTEQQQGAWLGIWGNSLDLNLSQK